MITSMLLLQANYILTGQLSPDMAKLAIEEGKIPNEDLARSTYDGVTMTLYFVLSLNVIGLLLTCKWLKITKFWFYSSILIHFLEVFLPREETAHAALQYKIVSVIT